MTSYKLTYAFSHFSHVILLSNANSEIPREIIRNFGSIVFYVPENPQKHPETQNWLFPRELGSSEFNLRIRQSEINLFEAEPSKMKPI